MAISSFYAQIPSTLCQLLIQERLLHTTEDLTQADLRDSNWLYLWQQIRKHDSTYHLRNNFSNFTLGLLLLYLHDHGYNIDHILTHITLINLTILKTIARIILICPRIQHYQPQFKRTLVQYVREYSHITQISHIYTHIYKYARIPLDKLLIYFQVADIKSLYEYPVCYHDINYLRCQSDLVLRLTVQCYDCSIDSKLLHYEDLVFALSRGYLPNLQIDFDRYEQLRSCHGLALRSLQQLYNLPTHLTDTVDLIRILARTQICTLSALDKLLLTVTPTNLPEIASDLGMLIPISFSATTKSTSITYFLNNLSQYTHIQLTPTSTTPLAQLSDQALFDRIGIMIAYDSRQHLLDSISKIHSATQMFFIDNYRHSYNSETAVMFTPITDMTTLLIGYGSLKHYLAFGIDELLVYFEVGEDGDFKFAKPIPHLTLAQAEYFTIAEIHILTKLLQQYSHLHEDIPTLIQKIHTGLAANVHADADIFMLRKQFQQYSATVKHTFQQSFCKLFEVGMYCRRWLGPPHAYPITENTTLVNIEPSLLFTNVSLALSRFVDELFTLSKDYQDIFYNLICYKLIRGHLQRLNKLTLTQVLHKLCNISSNENSEVGCMRIGSNILIGTSYYYLRLFHHYRIPNFNEHEIDNII